MALLISADVVNALLGYFMSYQPVGTLTLVRAFGVDTFLVGASAQSLVFGTFVDVSALGEAIALVALATYAVNGLRVLRDTV